VALEAVVGRDRLDDVLEVDPLGGAACCRQEQPAQQDGVSSFSQRSI